MIYKDTFRYGLYAAGATVVLALTAIFGKFSQLMVVGDQLSLSYVLLAVIFIGVGYITGSRAKGITADVLNGSIGSLIVGLALVILIFIEANVDLTFVF